MIMRDNHQNNTQLAEKAPCKEDASNKITTKKMSDEALTKLALAHFANDFKRVRNADAYFNFKQKIGVSNA